MTEEVFRHYDRFLARHYGWMFGGTFADNVSAQRTRLETSLPASFRKLRLTASVVADWLVAAGYQIVVNEPAGRMQIVLARRSR